MFPKRSCTGGFTLIEVLVVVAIISLLVSILIPAFISARDSARLVVCQSNQKNIAMAWQSYLIESRDRLPRGTYVFATYGGKQGRGTGYGGPGDTGSRKRFLNRYMKLPEVVGEFPEHNLPEDKHAEAAPARISEGVRVFQCPGDSGPLYMNAQQYSYGFFDYFGTSYRTNRFLIGPMPPKSPLDACAALIEEVQKRWEELSVSISAFSDFSRLVLSGDFSFDHWQDGVKIDPPQEFHARVRRSTPSPQTGTGWFYYNLAFMDGHVAYTGVSKGIYVSPNYTMIPFRDLQKRFAEDQRAGYSPPQ